MPVHVFVDALREEIRYIVLNLISQIKFVFFFLISYLINFSILNIP